MSKNFDTMCSRLQVGTYVRDLYHTNGVRQISRRLKNHVAFLNHDGRETWLHLRPDRFAIVGRNRFVTEAYHVPLAYEIVSPVKVYARQQWIRIKNAVLEWDFMPYQMALTLCVEKTL